MAPIKAFVDPDSVLARTAQAMLTAHAGAPGTLCPVCGERLPCAAGTSAAEVVAAAGLAENSGLVAAARRGPEPGPTAVPPLRPSEASPVSFAPSGVLEPPSVPAPPPFFEPLPTSSSFPSPAASESSPAFEAPVPSEYRPRRARDLDEPSAGPAYRSSLHVGPVDVSFSPAGDEPPSDAAAVHLLSPAEIAPSPASEPSDLTHDSPWPTQETAPSPHEPAGIELAGRPSGRPKPEADPSAWQAGESAQHVADVTEPSGPGRREFGAPTSQEPSGSAGFGPGDSALQGPSFEPGDSALLRLGSEPGDSALQESSFESGGSVLHEPSGLGRFPTTEAHPYEPGRPDEQEPSGLGRFQPVAPQHDLGAPADEPSGISGRPDAGFVMRHTTPAGPPARGAENLAHSEPSSPGLSTGLELPGADEVRRVVDAAEAPRASDPSDAWRDTASQNADRAPVAGSPWDDLPGQTYSSPQPDQTQLVPQSGETPSGLQSGETPSGLQSGGTPSGLQSGGTLSGPQPGEMTFGVHAGAMQSDLQPGETPSGLQPGGTLSGLQSGGRLSGLQTGDMRAGLQAGETESGLQASGTPSGVQAGGTPSGVQAGGTPSGLQAAEMQSGLQAAEMQSGLQAAEMQSGLQAGETISGLQSGETQFGAPGDQLGAGEGPGGGLPGPGAGLDAAAPGAMAAVDGRPGSQTAMPSLPPNWRQNRPLDAPKFTPSARPAQRVNGVDGHIAPSPVAGAVNGNAPAAGPMLQGPAAGLQGPAAVSPTHPAAGQPHPAAGQPHPAAGQTHPAAGQAPPAGQPQPPAGQSHAPGGLVPPVAGSAAVPNPAAPGPVNGHPGMPPAPGQSGPDSPNGSGLQVPQAPSSGDPSGLPSGTNPSGLQPAAPSGHNPSGPHANPGPPSGNSPSGLQAAAPSGNNPSGLQAPSGNNPSGLRAPSGDEPSGLPMSRPGPAGLQTPAAQPTPEASGLGGRLAPTPTPTQAATPASGDEPSGLGGALGYGSQAAREASEQGARPLGNSSPHFGGAPAGPEQNAAPRAVSHPEHQLNRPPAAGGDTTANGPTGLGPRPARPKLEAPNMGQLNKPLADREQLGAPPHPSER
ncbi:hypothetical protein [Actinoplanes sp. URMC 104]|uniref:hypothetical protein n=1 Tax=Actinoplanes sp. URMC 104 TaxID=3423409 RepID=UPI003F1A2178